MFTVEEHLDNLTRHIDLVREATTLLGKKLIKIGRADFGRLLIARGYVHDAGKFYGIQWDYMHAGKDVSKEKLALAVHEHQRTEEHHPEFWGEGITGMPEIAVAEMVCDWYARSQEFGSSLRDWIENTAVEKWNIDKSSQHYKWITQFVDLLLENTFVRIEEEG
jgi:hypothetical protein